ncbi:2-dehydropantoate 2-reductase [Sporosarcina sp. Marseille-Q4063]|uniref:ketopantoate reductase family protein n=1 Tax=Sporosarcina sp. Marseille-Q4063 TaxID=2810514 RepID=UPI001BAE8FD3|nr:2-dehydropantoate 2-reductase [Sporosarcina sp. Marseille-Q4063]QUW21790.1 2-dehydropantoate 2-reductase [Sporosarcina sp. Marseille-Q4063]
MDVVIVGGGSVGLLLGSYLSESGLKVTMVVRREEQSSELNKKGIRRVNEDGSESVFRVYATTAFPMDNQDSVWIIAVKYIDLQQLLIQLDRLEIKNPMLFIQNGLDHYSLANDTSLPHLAFATVEHGARRLNDNTVQHNGVGLVTIGAGRGDSTVFDIIENAHSGNFPVKRHADAEFVLMRKVLINCMINPLTAILEVENGELLTNPSCHELFVSLYDELINAFPEMEPHLSLEAVSAVCQKTAHNKSSMLSDRLAGRPMEIKTIITAVIEKAHALHKSVPLLAMLEKMLYAIESKGEKL